MAEYIEREALLEKVDDQISDMQESPYQDEIDLTIRGMEIVRDSIEFATTADVVEVKHGEWIEYQTPNIICCSECDWGTGVDEKTFKYCPNCGAKMDLKEGVNHG